MTTSSESTTGPFGSFPANPRAGLNSRVRMPLSAPLAEEKMGVLLVSWQRKVHKFFTSLSEGLVRMVEEGEEQMSMKAAMAEAERA